MLGVGPLVVPGVNYMSCTTAGRTSELEFVLALHTRSKAVGECRGPVLRLSLSPWRVFTLERIFDSPTAHDVLWDGYHDDGDKFGSEFSLCGAHWLDLACLLWMRARQHTRTDWHTEADHLLRDVCWTAGWDPKEIVNMFAWQRAELT